MKITNESLITQYATSISKSELEKRRGVYSRVGIGAFRLGSGLLLTIGELFFRTIALFVSLFTVQFKFSSINSEIKVLHEKQIQAALEERAKNELWAPDSEYEEKEREIVELHDKKRAIFQAPFKKLGNTFTGFLFHLQVCHAIVLGDSQFFKKLHVQKKPLRPHPLAPSFASKKERSTH